MAYGKILYEGLHARFFDLFIGCTWDYSVLWYVQSRLKL